VSHSGDAPSLSDIMKPAQALGRGFPWPSNMNLFFNYYPSPYMMLPGWYSQPPPAALNLALAAVLPMLPTLNPAAPTPKQVALGNYPNITDWLAYCDQHIDRCGEDFSAHSMETHMECSPVRKTEQDRSLTRLQQVTKLLQCFTILDSPACG
jgi:hypothetical protein